MKLLTFTALAVALVAIAQSTTIITTSVIPMENSFYELECPHPGDFEYWLLNGEDEVLTPTVTFREEMTIFLNGSIIFKSIKIEYAGVHQCFRRSEGILRAHSIPLEIRPLPSQNLWQDVYQAKFLTGLIAALVCFFVFTLSCLVYNKRWRAVAKDSDVSPIIENGYDNPGMFTGEDVASSTKM